MSESSDFTQDALPGMSPGEQEVLDLGNASVSMTGCPVCSYPVVVIHLNSKKENHACS